MGGAATHQHDVADWNRMLDVNLTSAFLCSRAVLPGMIERDQGRIVFVSSRTAHLARAGQVGYAVAKAGVEVLAQTIAEENPHPRRDRERHRAFGHRHAGQPSVDAERRLELMGFTR
jgi:NAD(P)-dependent dehydrogenase (short-subunit alcohol dehydrogenase family)